MRRKIYAKLLEWQHAGLARLPLVLYGARQVGKTYLLRQFGHNCFDNIVYIDFERDRALAAYFEEDLNPKTIVRRLEQFYHVQIKPEKTLIIFDEIQSCESALTALKYFAQDAPEYCVVAAGSLLGVVINRSRFSFPVGKVHMLTLYPMDFEEFLWAKKEELLATTIREHYNSWQALPLVLHEQALSLYREYLLIGGMPAVVTAYLQGQNAQEIKRMIYASYVADMAKYTSNTDSVKIVATYESLPAQLAKDNKKFQYKIVKQGGRAAYYGEAVNWLVNSGVVLQCFKCTQGVVPLVASEDLGSFKLYYGDLGVFNSKTNLTMQNILEGNTYQGALAENSVAIALKTNNYDLHYWESDSTAEVDFLLTQNGQVIPVECKAGSHVRSRSLDAFMKRYNSPYGIRISTHNFGFENKIQSVPLYGVFCV